MGAGQREIGCGMVEIPQIPVARVVAKRAIDAIHTRMRIVIPVASATFFARYRRTAGCDGSLCTRAIGGRRSAESARDRAGVSTFSSPVRHDSWRNRRLARLVHIVFAMAIHTAGAGLDGFHRLSVTSLAGGFAMCAAQYKIGGLVMIEQAGFPVVGIVAIATLGTIAALVAVVLLMAVDACLAVLTKCAASAWQALQAALT